MAFSLLCITILVPVAAQYTPLMFDGCHSADGVQQGSDGSVKIACVGDSITEGAHASSKQNTYPSQLQNLLDDAYGADAYGVTNLGHCGATMLKSGNNPYNRTGQYRTLTDNTWDIVVVMLGTNDAKDKGSSRGKFDNWQHDCGGPGATSLAGCSFAADYKDMIKVVQGLGTTPEGPKIYVAIPPPLMQQSAYGMNQTVINSVHPKLIPLIQQDTGVLGPIDVFAGLGGVADWPNHFPTGGCALNASQPQSCDWFCNNQSCDQCHPNNNGYMQLARTVQIGLGLTGTISV